MPRILLIDDDDSFRKMLQLTLHSLGYEIVEARQGDEGLRLLAQETIDLVLTDLIMPDKEGVETIMEIQRRYPKMKVIAMSGGGRMSSKQLLKMTGQLCDVPTIAKPFSNYDLSAIITASLARSSKA